MSNNSYPQRNSLTRLHSPLNVQPSQHRNRAVTLGKPQRALIFQAQDRLGTARADLEKAAAKHQSATLAYIGDVAAAIKASGYNPGVAGTLLGHAAALPGFGPQVGKLRQLINSNPGQLRLIVDRAIAMRPKQHSYAIAGTAPRAGASHGKQAFVLMRAPNGQKKAVPSEHVTHYKSRGASVLERSKQ